MRLLKNFLQDEQGVIPTEYAVMVAGVGILLAVGVWILFQAMSGLFNAWSTYFSGGG